MTWEEAELTTDNPELKTLLQSLAARNAHADVLLCVKQQFEINESRGEKNPTLDEWLKAIQDLPLYPSIFPKNKNDGRI